MGTEVIYVPVKAKCPDGRVRTVRARATIYGGLYPDTAFTVPAYAKAKGKTVGGFITPADGLGWVQDHAPGLEFRAVKTGRNYGVFAKEQGDA